MNSILSFLDFRSNQIPKIGAILIALSSITGGILLSQPFYFGALAICGLAMFLKGKLRINNIYVLLFLFVCVFSLFVNNPPSYFRSWERLGVYSLVLLVVSPFLSDTYSTRLRARLLYYFMQISIVLSIGSFFAFFLGINLFVRLGEQLEIGSGTFSGLMNHSMVLGPVAGLSGLVLFVEFLADRNKQLRLLTVIAALCCMGACLLSASRAAVGATGLACVFAIFRFYKNRVSRMIKVVLILVGLLAATFPLWEGLTDYLVQKQSSNDSMGSAIYSRERKFNARITEFQSSPLLGIGYYVVDSKYDIGENGQIEPGSSWLAVASMTGIMGLSLFIIICIRGVIRSWRIQSPSISCILGGMLFFFFFHMIAEGYIFAPKSFLSLLFWLVIAVSEGIYVYEKETAVKVS